MEVEVIEDAPILIPNNKHQNFTESSNVIKKGTILLGDEAQIKGKRRGEGFTYKLFKTKNNQVLINEIAPRVHNSGHYTIEACVTSQFEQHIRAVTGLPLGKTEMIVPASVMINILGNRFGSANVSGMDKALAIPNVAVHIYNKKDTKPERKMGHITVTGKTITEALKKAKLARKYISI